MSRDARARRYAHVRAAIAFILRSGGEDVRIKPGSAIRLRWRHGDMPMVIALSAKCAQEERGTALARQAIRRRYAAIGVEVGA